jgi:hypothetical protein
MGCWSPWTGESGGALEAAMLTPCRLISDHRPIRVAVLADSSKLSEDSQVTMRLNAADQDLKE